MRVLVDSQSLEALFQAAEKNHKVLVAKVRGSVRAEPKAEEVSKVSDYNAVSDVTAVEQARTFVPRKRSATSTKE